MDALSDVLSVIRLKGTLFLDAEFREPWCVDVPAGNDFARKLAPAHDQVAICHLITEGRCWTQLPGAEPVALAAGDVVTYPHGDAHLLGCGEHNGLVTADDVVAVDVPRLARASYGGKGAVTIAICGWFAYDHKVANVLTDALPRIVRTNIRRRPSGAWLEGSIRYAAEEASSSAAGSTAVTDKLAELLFVEALRGYVEDMPPEGTSWLAGLRDPIVGRCIALMHARPAEAWTVASLAQEVSASRTVLADRFTAQVGVPPMQYLARWRAAKAGHLLRGGSLTLSQVAEEVGYASEAAFSRAFRREFGVPPGAWRRKADAGR